MIAPFSLPRAATASARNCPGLRAGGGSGGVMDGSVELRLAALMAADAVVVAKATAHWREAENLGVAPPNKGKLHANGLPARIVAHLRAAGASDADEIAGALGVPRRRVAQAIRDLHKRGSVARVALGRYAAGQGVA